MFESYNTLKPHVVSASCAKALGREGNADLAVRRREPRRCELHVKPVVN